MDERRRHHGAERAAEVWTLWPQKAAQQMRAISEECVRKTKAMAIITGKGQPIANKGGFVAEALHAETFNLDAILQDKSVRAFTDQCRTTATPGHDPAGGLLAQTLPAGRQVPANDQVHDILIKDLSTGRTEHSAQLKYMEDIDKAANEFRTLENGTAKYGSADSFVAPAEQVDGIRASAERASKKNRTTRPAVADAADDVAKKATGTLSHDGVESQELSLKDARRIASGSDEGKGAHARIQDGYKLRSTVNQSLKAAGSAAVMTSVIVGTLGTIECLGDVRAGRMSVEDAVKDICATVAIAAADSALKAGVATAAVSLTARSVPAFFSGSVLTSSLATGSVAGAAVCAVDLVECLVLVAAGRMTLAQLEDRTGKNLFQTAAGVAGAAIGGALGAPAGPLGVAIGSFVGGLVASMAMTVAIDNHIDGVYGELLAQADLSVRNGRLLQESTLYLVQSQQFFAEFRLDLQTSERAFDLQMSQLDGAGGALAQRIALL